RVALDPAPRLSSVDRVQKESSADIPSATPFFDGAAEPPLGVQPSHVPPARLALEPLCLPKIDRKAPPIQFFESSPKKLRDRLRVLGRPVQIGDIGEVFRKFGVGEH